VKKIILCQPDGKKGCSACCGLLNFKDISKKSLTGFLEEGKERAADAGRETENDLSYRYNDTLRDNTSHICPYQGFLEPNRPGCLIHPAFNESDERDLSLFGKKICDGFLCPAHELLTEKEKKIIISNIDDWYLYTIAVIDPLSTQWIINEIQQSHQKNNSEEKFKFILNKALGVHSESLSEHTGSVFFYSLSEYNIARKQFSLVEKSNQQNRNAVRKIINSPA